MPQRFGLTVPLISVWKWALLAGLYSCLSLLRGHPLLSKMPDIPMGLDAALSFAMALLIAMRVNRAYERWWEARKLWGALVNASRNLAVKVRESVKAEEPQRRAMRDLIAAFAYGLKDHLREDADLKALPGFKDAAERPKHLPSYITRKIYEQLQSWRNTGELSEHQLWLLDAEARQFLDICGACERIKTTRMSISFRAITLQCITLYLLIFPWSLPDDFHFWTIPLTVFVAYLVMAGEWVAHFIEEPFGVHEDHLNLEAISATIERTVSEILLDAK